jgi:MFS family permease
MAFEKDWQFKKFCAYGFLKNLRFFEPFMVLFLMSAGLSYLQIGLLYSLRMILQNLLEIPAGIVSDTLGRRRTMITSFVFYILSFLAFFFSGKMTGFIIAMSIFALGEAFRTGTHKAMIFEYLKMKGWESEKVTYYGYTRSWSQRGSALSALIAAGLVILSHNYRMIFLFSIVPYVLDLALIASYPKALDGKKMNIRFSDIGKNFKEVLADFWYSFKNPLMLKTIANSSIYSGYYKALKDFLQPVIKSLALAIPILTMQPDETRSAVLVGVIYYLIYRASSLAARNSGKFSLRFSSLQMALTLSIFIGAGAGLLSGLFYRFHIPAVAVLFFVAVYLVENLRKPIGMSCTADLLEKDILATALSAAAQLETLFGAIFTALLGFLADKFGLANGLMIVSLLLITLTPTFFIRNSQTKA